MHLRVHDFIFVVMRLNRSLRKLKNNRLTMGDYRSIHISCMYYLHIYGSMPAAELCKKCDEDKAAISRALKFLEENDCIVNSASKEGKHRTYIELTEKGEVISQLITAEVSNIIQSLVPVLDEDERVTLYKLLTKLCDGLDKAATR